METFGDWGTGKCYSYSREQKDVYSVLCMGLPLAEQRILDATLDSRYSILDRTRLIILRISEGVAAGGCSKACSRVENRLKSEKKKVNE
jgi:hypothetical protein